MKHSLLFSDLKTILEMRYGKKGAKKIIEAARAEDDRLEREYPDIPGDGAIMIPFAAYYIVLKKYDPKHALPFMCRYGTYMGKKFRKVIHGVTSVPFVPRLIWSNMTSIMEKASSAEKGYTRKLVIDDKVMGVDILSCPIYDAAVMMGIPEAAQIICAMDREYMTGIRNIEYKRTSSVAEGGECCDYRLSFDKNKK